MFALESWRLLLHKPSGFVVAGLVAFLTDFAIFNGLWFIGASQNIANIAGYAGGLVVNYLINSRVFRAQKPKIRENFRSLLRFAVLALVSSVYVIGIFAALSDYLVASEPLEVNAIRGGIILSGAIIRFFLLKLWVFGN